MKRKIAKCVLVLGVLLVLAAAFLLIFNLISANSKQQNTDKLMQQIDSILPQSSTGTLSDQKMPVLEVNGQDIIAVVEIPAHDVSLPVGSTWDKKGIDAYPRRFSGSAYDRTLIVGGSDRKGQLDCLSKVDIGDIVTITDMTGAVFNYQVDWVDRADSANIETLTDSDSHLTLFVRDTYSLEYVIVRCIAK